MTEQVLSNLVKCLMQAETINAILRTSQPDLTAGPQRDIAVALTAEMVEHDPHLWKTVERCEFQLVYASPEILLGPTSYFFKNILKNLNHPFLTNLVTVALDECHSLLYSGTYRPACRLLKNLRDLLCDVSFTAFSASMTPLDIIQLRASMSLDDAVLIQQSIRKGNLKIWVAQLCHKGLYTDLDAKETPPITAKGQDGTGMREDEEYPIIDDNDGYTIAVTEENWPVIQTFLPT